MRKIIGYGLIAATCAGVVALAVVNELRAPPQIITLNPHGLSAAYLIPADRAQVHITAIVPFSEMDNQGTLGLAH